MSTETKTPNELALIARAEAAEATVTELRARVTELLESGSLMAKECGEAQARVKELDCEIRAYKYEQVPNLQKLLGRETTWRSESEERAERLAAAGEDMRKVFEAVTYETIMQHNGIPDALASWSAALADSPAKAPLSTEASLLAILSPDHAGRELTASKAASCMLRDGSVVTGFVLTDPKGGVGIVNQSAVRWFDADGMFAMMHDQLAPSSAPADAKAPARTPDAFIVGISNLTNTLLAALDKLGAPDDTKRALTESGDCDHVMFWIEGAQHPDTARLDWLDSMASESHQLGWRLTLYPGQQHRIAIRTGHNNAFDTARAAIDAARNGGAK